MNVRKDVSIFEFKLNLQEYILAQYVNNYDELKADIIPGYLSFISGLVENNDYPGEYSKLNVIEESLNDLIEDFSALENITNDLYSSYSKILADYREGKGILYSTKFLKLNEDSKKSRVYFEKKYSEFCKKAEIKYKKIDREEFYDTDGQVGTGVKHFKKFSILKKYFENDEVEWKNRSVTSVYYDKKDEHILIEAKSESDAIRYSEKLKSIINSSKAFTNMLGVVTINPIYTHYSITGEVNKLTITEVYPNGIPDPSQDRYDVIKSSQAAKYTQTLEAQPNKPLKIDEILENEKENLSKGYISNIIAEGKNVIRKTMIKVIDSLRKE